MSYQYFREHGFTDVSDAYKVKLQANQLDYAVRK
jgi:hypothetical protein